MSFDSTMLKDYFAEHRLRLIRFAILGIPVLGIFIKIWITYLFAPTFSFDGNLQSGSWFGADGENYLTATGGLIDDGFTSNQPLLTFWPAGYPVFIWLFSMISGTQFFWIISITQSIFFAYASYFFAKALIDTKLNRFVLPIIFILTVNPTLSLASLVIGYENPIASCMLMVTGLIIKSQQGVIDKRFWIRVAAVGGFFALAAFMQPRWLLTTAIVAAIWAFVQQGRKKQALIVLIVMAIMALSPLALILRNIEAGKGSVISTNLGVTMRIGAGVETDGGYNRKGPEVPCEPVPPATVTTDNDLVKCVIKWYLTNPVKGVELGIRKSFHYWSPWSGPIVNGTMARNPWLKISPVQEIATGSEQGRSLVYGAVGKVISWAWLLGGISLFFTGFFWLRSMKGIYSLLAWLALSPVIASWVIGMGTIGDHRFRIPTMALSLFLQVMGYYALKKRVTSGSFAHTD